jgi:hypothetical protein
MSRKRSSESGAPMTTASRSGGSGKRGIPVLSTTSGMARRLLPVFAALMSPMVATACIVPIPAEPAEDPDGGTNAFPVIKFVMPAMPGPISLDPMNPNPPPVSLTLADSDLGDILHVRAFRDYDTGNTGSVGVEPPPIGPSGQEDRGTTIGTAGWCMGASQTGVHQIDLVVADRDWDTTSLNPPFPNRTPKGNGKTSMRSWVVQCTPTP